MHQRCRSIVRALKSFNVASISSVYTDCMIIRVRIAFHLHLLSLHLENKREISYL
jgi:hypothetical protein